MPTLHRRPGRGDSPFGAGRASPRGNPLTPSPQPAPFPCPPSQPPLPSCPLPPPLATGSFVLPPRPAPFERPSPRLRLASPHLQTLPHLLGSCFSFVPQQPWGELSSSLTQAGSASSPALYASSPATQPALCALFRLRKLQALWVRENRERVE